MEDSDVANAWVISSEMTSRERIEGYNPTLERNYTLSQKIQKILNWKSRRREYEKKYNLQLEKWLGVTEKGLAKMKGDDIEKLFESMKEEFKLIYQAEQEKKKKTAEKAARTRLHTTVAKFNEAIEERRIGNRRIKPPIPGWIGYSPYDNYSFDRARYIIQSLEKILESPESESLTTAEIKNKVLSDGDEYLEALRKEAREKDYERQVEYSRRLQKELEQKEQERQKLRDAIELKRKEEMEKREEEIRKGEEAIKRRKAEEQNERYRSTFTGVKNLVRIANGQAPVISTTVTSTSKSTSRKTGSAREKRMGSEELELQRKKEREWKRNQRKHRSPEAKQATNAKEAERQKEYRLKKKIISIRDGTRHKEKEEMRKRKSEASKLAAARRRRRKKLEKWNIFHGKT